MPRHAQFILIAALSTLGTQGRSEDDLATIVSSASYGVLADRGVLVRPPGGMPLRTYRVRRVYFGPLLAGMTVQVRENGNLDLALKTHSMGTTAVLLVHDRTKNGALRPQFLSSCTALCLKDRRVFRLDLIGDPTQFLPIGEGPLSDRLYGLPTPIPLETFERDLHAAIRKNARVEHALKDPKSRQAILLEAFGPPIPIREYTDDYRQRPRHHDALARHAIETLFLQKRYSLGLDVVSRTWTGARAFNRGLDTPESLSAILSVAADDNAPLHLRVAALWVIQGYPEESNLYQRIDRSRLAALLAHPSVELRRAAVETVTRIGRRDPDLVRELVAHFENETDPQILQAIICAGHRLGLPKEQLVKLTGGKRNWAWCRAYLQRIDERILRFRYLQGAQDFHLMRNLRLQIGDPPLTIDLSAEEKRYVAVREQYLNDPTSVAPGLGRALAKYGRIDRSTAPERRCLLIRLETPLRPGGHRVTLFGDGGGKTHVFQLSDLEIEPEHRPN
ncbi:MAG: hypothetical protein AAF517_17215 [Planctomycetota bacterium]